METETLPPWGILDNEMLDEIRDHFVPADWRPAGGAVQTPENWAAFVEDLLTVIGSVLWPRYQAGSSAWDAPGIRALIDVDFVLMDSLARQFDTPIKAQPGTGVTHGELFLDEDNDDAFPFGLRYERYDPTLSRSVRESLSELMRQGVADKTGTVAQQLKQELQRPRAFQVAKIQGRQFAHQLANTASTPSMISAHCLQGAMAACNAFATLEAQMSPDSKRAMGQYAVDIGDRRVMAGVHYPSDNLSSWYTALRLIPQVFDASTAPRVMEFLWGAISSQSAVYELIDKDVRANGAASAYFKADAAIKGLVA